MGYRIHLDGVEPTIKGCPDCDKEHGGVPSAIVRWWPSAWRAVARKLDERAATETTKAAVPQKSP